MESQKLKIPYREFLTVCETAAILAITPTTVRKVIKSGELEAFTVHGRYRIPIRKLDDFISRNMIQKKLDFFDEVDFGIY